MNDLGQKRNSPWVSLVYLLALTLVCALGFQLLVVFVGKVVLLGMGASGSGANLGVDFLRDPIFSYALVVSSSIGTFLAPAWILQRLEPYSIYFPMNTRSQGFLYVLVALFLIAFGPAMQWIAQLNMNMQFPTSLKAVEAWMRMKEDSMAALTKDMVMVDSWTLLLVNLFAVAVVPAVAEEYYFRGSLMHIIQRMVKSPHLAVWITAILFSAIHVQFFGFLPRLLLGAFFGYMLLWTQNIWIPILGHFINNASAVVLAFYYTRQGNTYEELQSFEAYSIFTYLGSFVVSGIIGWYFYTKTKEINYGNRLGKN